MKQTAFKIGHIPALLWGEPANRLIVAVHGNLSHKADTVIELLAEECVPRGYQVLSFDLPEHGERKNESTRCKVQPCVQELCAVMEFARTQAQDISLFGCSIGAYFSLLAYQNETLRQALFLSPVVDMERIIQNMMMWFSISESRLQTEQEIGTPIGQTLYWDYYCYVKEHPIIQWAKKTAILYGTNDEICPADTVTNFTNRFGCQLTTLAQGEHFFHSPEQLSCYRKWLRAELTT